MKAQPELVAAALQLVPALLAVPKLHIHTMRATAILMMRLQRLKVLLLLQKHQQPHLPKVQHQRLKLLHLPLKLLQLHQQLRLLLLKLQHLPLKALLLLQKQSSWTVRCI